MPAPPLLEFEALIAPIPGESPAGSSVPFEIREKLEEGRKEVDPETFAKTDPMRPENAVKADWPVIFRLTQATLKETSKDLLVAARLTEALVKLHGFAGLRDGLHLLRLLVEHCWNRINPPIESEEDLEVRAAPFLWLDDTDRGARFPTTVRMVNLAVGEPGRFGWQQWKQAQTGKGTVTSADFEKAIQASPRDFCQAAVDDLNQSWEELDALAKDLNTKIGQYAPGFSGIRQAVSECRSLAQQILQKKGPAPADLAAPSEDDEAGASGAGAESMAEKKVKTRADVYARIAESAAILQQMEPHSPVPYLLLHAVSLGELQFPDLMKSLILNPDVLKVMNRELGIKDVPPEKK